MNREPIERESMVFAGSAKATSAMKQYAKRAVLRAIELERLIIFGDNPSGIDMMVLLTCLEANYEHFSIQTLRREDARSLSVAWYKLQVTSKGRYEEYHDRDTVMILMGDSAMFIWDGKSRGTREGYEYAVEKGIPAFLVNFATGEPVLTKSQGIMKVSA